MTPTATPDDAIRLMDRLDTLARFSEAPDRLTRTYLSPEHKAAAEQVAEWMRAAGMAVTMDPLATIVGRYGGDRPDARTLLIGSHIDTVRDAGKYDGQLGVLLAISLVEILNRTGRRLPFAIEVLAFGDEEGVRFPGTLRGSAAVAGTLTPDQLSVTDAAGISVADALRGFGCDPEAHGTVARRASDLLAFLEVHIEQGPVLEARDLPVGIVTAIAAANRYKITLTGMAGHAGTVPMGLRRDALAAAAECALAVERICAARTDLVGTVGRMEVLPGAVNVIPGEVRFTLDLRGPSAAARDDAWGVIQAAWAEITARRGTPMTIERTHRHDGCVCDPWLMDAMAQSVRRCGIAPFRLPSGAGHDAMSLAGLTGVAMLFVRCAGGISHNPAESITTADAEAALRVMLDLLLSLPPVPPS
ncbi:MAG: hypothetical protein RLY86_2033 [Pseudomonadota bacterium]|jgi:allantoate deiminase